MRFSSSWMNYRHSFFHFHGVLCKAERKPLRAEPTELTETVFILYLQHKRQQFICMTGKCSPLSPLECKGYCSLRQWWNLAVKCPVSFMHVKQCHDSLSTFQISMISTIHLNSMTWARVPLYWIIVFSMSMWHGHMCLWSYHNMDI